MLARLIRSAMAKRPPGVDRNWPQIDMVEISLVEWPTDPGKAPRLLGRLRDEDLVGEVLSRLKERSDFANDYIGLALDDETKAALDVGAAGATNSGSSKAKNSDG